LQRGLPKDQQQQLVGTLKASGQFVAELHPGVLAVEAAYGRDCYGERQLSAWERIGAAVGAVGGFLGRAWHGAQTVGRSVAQTGARVIVVGYARARQSVYRVLKREGQVHHVLSEQIMKKLNDHKTLRGRFHREQWKVRAAAPHDHCGYQTWHRKVDQEIVDWLEKNQDATPEKFIAKLREIYSRHDMLIRFPDALDIIK
jgi:hypothetical protein